MQVNEAAAVGCLLSLWNTDQERIHTHTKKERKKKFSQMCNNVAVALHYLLLKYVALTFPWFYPGYVASVNYCCGGGACSPDELRFWYLQLDSFLIRVPLETDLRERVKFRMLERKKK